MSSTVIVFASSRANGNTRGLVDWIAQELGAGIIDLLEKDISPFDYEHRNINDDFVPVINQLLDYESVIFATPVYWYGPCAQMKVFIDRLSDLLDVEPLREFGRSLKKKKAYIACTSISRDASHSFIQPFRDTFDYLAVNYCGYIHVNCKAGFNKEQNLGAFYDFARLVRESTN